MQLRFATGGAAEGWAEVVMAASPFLVCSEASVLHEMAHRPGTLARYVVVHEREVVGVARVRETDAVDVSVMVQVRPDQQGRGVGRLLHQRVLAVVGDRAAYAIVNGDEHSLDVARHWGYVPEREHRVAAADPRAVSEPPQAPEGLTTSTLSDVAAAQVWQCQQQVADDDPSGLSRQMPLEEYIDSCWNDPLHRPDLGQAVLAGDEVVAFAQVTAASGRAWNAMTGTLPSYRGRGLATLAKAHALTAMAASGITVCHAGNDAANGPMLAVNDRLGYRAAASTWGSRRPAGTAEPATP